MNEPAKISSFGTTMTQSVGSGDIDLFFLAGVIWRGKWIIMIAAVLAVLAGAYYVLGIAVPKYQANTVLAIQDQGPNVVDIEAVISGVSAESEALNTEVEVLLSRGVLERLATRLDLTSDPEFNHMLKPAPLISVGQIIRFIRYLVGMPVAEKEYSDQDILNLAVSELRGAISASVKRQTQVITVFVTTEDETKSQDIANTLAEIYLDDQVQIKFDGLRNAVSWLSSQVVELEGEIRARQDEIKDRQSQSDYVNAEGLEIINLQMRELRERLIAETTDASRATANFVRLQEALKARNTQMMAELVQDPTMLRMARTAESDDLLADASVFMQRFNAILRRSETDQQRAKTQVAALEESIAALDIRVDAQAAQLIEVQQMQRELDTVAVLYETFLTRLKETTLQQGIQQADARVLSRAIDGRKVSPRTAVVGMMSLLIGLASGVGIALLRELRQSGFRTAEDLQAATGEKVIGQIPKMPIRRRNQLLEYLDSKQTSAAVEAVRNLRTSVLLSNMDNPPQVIMSTSSVPAEGKTTLAISLARNLAGLDKKVLLIEGDIRRRTLDEYFTGKIGKDGILSVISGDVSMEDAVNFSPALRADVLMGQVSQTNAADVFSSQKFTDFIAALRARYDYIVIDTPPVLVVPDARVVGQHCDAIICSVRWDSTTNTQIQATLRELESVNLDVTGLVLSQVDAKGMKRYGYGDYGAYGKGYYQ